MNAKRKLSVDGHLAELEKMLVFEKNFSNTYRYFFDHLAENDAFMRMAERTTDSDFEKIMQAIGQGFLQEEVTVTDFLSMPLPDRHFVHGMCRINGRLVTFFFFKMISMGMAAMVTLGGEYHTLFARFTAFETPDKHIALYNLSVPGSSIH